MTATEYRCYAGTPATPQPFEVFAYPMGDTTVRVAAGATPAPGSQLLWAAGATVDWAVVCAWAELAAAIDPAAARVLVLPYLPSARGDKDVPSPARINARLAAATGITDLVTIDPHSPVWLDTLAAAGPGVRVHPIPVARVTAAAVAGAGYAGVISPDRGAMVRAGAVADLLGLPLHVAAKHRDPGTGRLTGYRLADDLADGDYLVVDDICDGGGTFGLLADAVPAGATLDLWVTHGGFTGPQHSAAVRARYRRVHTTDSLPSAVAAHRAHPDAIALTELHPWITAAITAAVPNRKAAP